MTFADVRCVDMKLGNAKLQDVNLWIYGCGISSFKIYEFMDLWIMYGYAISGCGFVNWWIGVVNLWIYEFTTAIKMGKPPHEKMKKWN